MALFGKKKPKLPSYEGASLETLLEDPQWSFALGQAGIDPSRCEVVLRLADCTVGTGMGRVPENARPALLLGQGNIIAVAFPGERDIQVVKRDTSRAELQTQRSGMFQILFGPATNLDGFMFYGHEDNLVANTPEGDAFGQAMLAFLRGQLQPQQVIGTPQSISASAPAKPNPQMSAPPEFTDPEDVARWQMMQAVHASLIDMMDKYQLCFEKAEHIEKAYGMANTEFVNGVQQHPISRENFRKLAEQEEQELPGLLVALQEVTATARGQWHDLVFLLPGDEENDIMKFANWCMASGVDSEVMSSIVSNSMFINTDFGTTRASFWDQNERVLAALNQQQQG